jgi:hypothetical protein
MQTQRMILKSILVSRVVMHPHDYMSASLAKARIQLVSEKTGMQIHISYD